MSRLLDHRTTYEAPEKTGKHRYSQHSRIRIALVIYIFENCLVDTPLDPAHYVGKCHHLIMRILAIWN